jgi:glycosyltransferase involved in cell wall biosynthesis
MNPFLEFALILKFVLAYARIKPEMAFHFTVKNNIYGTFAAAMQRIPVVNNISGLGTAFIQKTTLSSVVLFLLKISQHFAFKIFCQNKDDYHFLIQKKVASHNQLILIPGSGVNTSKFHPSIRQSYKSSHPDVDGFTFLYAGRMLYDKGLNELMEAFQNITGYQGRCRLILCGFVDADNISAVTSQDIKNWSKVSGVEWIGSSDNIELIMAAADCVVLPSYREGMPKSLLEAGSMGLPVIATNVPGCKNIVINELNGLLCEPYNPESLQHAMEKMMATSQSDLAKMGKSARAQILRQYDENIVINEFFAVLESLE